MWSNQVNPNNLSSLSRQAWTRPKTFVSWRAREETKLWFRSKTSWGEHQTCSHQATHPGPLHWGCGLLQPPFIITWRHQTQASETQTCDPGWSSASSDYVQWCSRRQSWILQWSWLPWHQWVWCWLGSSEDQKKERSERISILQWSEKIIIKKTK